MNSASYSEAIGHIYDAAAAPDRWPSVMEEFADLLGGHSAWLSRLDLRDGSGSGIVVRMDPGAQDKYFAYYNALDPLSNVDDSRGRPEPSAPYIVTDEDRLPKSELMRTEFYNDFMKPIETHSVLMLRLSVRGTTVYGMNINRTRGRGSFGSADVALAASFQGHLARSLHLAERFDALRLLAAGGVDASSRTQGLMLAAGDGRIVHADDAAEDLLRGRNGLAVVAGRIEAVDRTASHRLRALIAAAASPRAATRRGGSVAIPSAARRTPLLLAVAPLQPGSLSVFGGERLVIVCATDPEAGARAAEARFAELFGLTAAEIRVARALLEGQSPREVAQALGLSVHTVRTHVAHLFGKTGARRQVELVQLLARAVGPELAPRRR